MHHAVDFLCLNDGVVTAWALAMHLNILDLHLHSRNYLCLNGIHDVILNQRRSPLKLKVPILHSLSSLSLGASVFIGVYLRKPTSKEGSRVYLTRGNLNGERGKTEETVPVRATTKNQQNFIVARGSTLQFHSWNMTHLSRARTVTVTEVLAGCFADSGKMWL